MKLSQGLVCLFIFFTCVLIYSSGSQLSTANDDIPNSLLAFNWLENQELNFDIFRDSHLYKQIIQPDRDAPYFFIEADNGHVSSPYPIGPAIVTFPIYVVFFIYLKLQGWFGAIVSNHYTESINIIKLTNETFLRQDRQQFDRLAGILITSLSAVLFYIASTIKFNRTTAIVSTFVYAFATSVWVVCSQGIRQNTMSNVVLLATLVALLKANRSQGRTKILFLLTAGFFCGLLPGCRPTSLVFVVPIVIYAIFVYRKQAIFFALGFLSILLNIAWNVYYFGLSNAFSGGYTKHFGKAPYRLKHFPAAFLGLLFSPNRGWIALCPVLLFTIPGIRQVSKRATGHEEKLLAGLTFSCFILFIQYCFYTRWPGIYVYGPSRFLIDTIPVLCFLINYFLSSHFSKVNAGVTKLFSRSFVTFLALLAFSTYVQFVGAFGDHNWNRTPTPQQMRIWDIRDNIVARTTKEVYHKIVPLVDDKSQYFAGLRGIIEEVQDQKGKPLKNPHNTKPSREKLLQAKLRNVGTSRWFGYDTGAERALVPFVKVSFTDEAGKEISRYGGRLFVKGTIEPNAEGMAIGLIEYPKQPGQYNMIFRLKPERDNQEIAESQTQYLLTVNVKPR